MIIQYEYKYKNIVFLFFNMMIKFYCFWFSKVFKNIVEIKIGMESHPTMHISNP
jgi:hypothetical protein